MAGSEVELSTCWLVIRIPSMVGYRELIVLECDSDVNVKTFIVVEL